MAFLASAACCRRRDENVTPDGELSSMRNRLRLMLITDPDASPGELVAGVTAGTVLVRGPCADGQTVALVSGERGDTILNTARCRNGKVTLRTHVNAEGYRDPLQVRIGERLYPVE